MAKTILIFSDGTGQIGGIKPDQRLSNVYKMYRAMRPGPSSPIKPDEQVAFYDPGLGAGETDGITFKRIRNLLESSVGTGIDENVIDCFHYTKWPFVLDRMHVWADLAVLVGGLRATF